MRQKHRNFSCCVRKQLLRQNQTRRTFCLIFLVERKQKHKIEEVMKNLFTNCYLLKVFKTLLVEIGNGQSSFYSAPSIFAVFRNLVREIWFKKSGSANLDFFSGSRKVVDQKKHPSLQNHFSTIFQKSGCRLNGPVSLFSYRKNIQLQTMTKPFLSHQTYQQNIKYFLNQK